MNTRIWFSTTLIFLVSSIGFGQSDKEFHAPKFVKYSIGESGASAYFPENDDLGLEITTSEDGSTLYTAEVRSEDYGYGIILVKFNGFTLDTAEDRENTLEGYLDYLQESFAIMSSAGYGKGHRLARDESAEGMIDFWMDTDGDEWSVTGWVKPDGLAVMFIYGPESYPNYSVSEFFFNGITF